MMREHLRLDVTVQIFSENQIELKFPHMVVSWRKPSPTLYKRIKHLLGYGNSLLYNESEEALPFLFCFLEELKQSSLLSYSVFNHDVLWASLTPYHSKQFKIKTKSLDPTHPFQLSRFAYLRVQNKTMLLSSPLVSAVLEVKHQMAFSILHALSTPISLEQFIQEFHTIDPTSIHDFFLLLYQADFLNDADNNPSLKCWEFHDLTFHTTSRLRGEQSSGATFRFWPEISPLPSIPKPKNSNIIPLFKPNLKTIIQSDRPFTDVLENRQSIRDHGVSPITLHQLGEFLYRTARVKQISPGGKYELTHRPYPGAGACHELEIYPLIHQCEGLESHLYHYLGDQHALEVISPVDSAKKEALLKASMEATLAQNPPQILFLITARFQRMSWKYESMAYSVILKNTGVLIQTMYLVATAMNLAPCAIGNGDSDLFSQMIDGDYYEETTVGEFILGTR